ncbi:MAG TPA: cbb3-type cytochrome c oxidase subunit I [Solirubrobacterales bacterium]|nr:cbb3-type cytochrome c oxidase subunit I [Solirubrobacterales bacterium]
MSDVRRPEIAVDGFPRRSRFGWADLVTSADHKEVAKILLVGSGGFLFIAALELLLMRLQLAIPENTFMEPYTFNRVLSLYGATSIFFFALPFVMGLFLYVAPLQVGARGTALPRLSQIGGALWVAGAVVLYAGFLWTPSEAGVNPLPPLSELAFLSNNGVDAWLTACGFATLGFVLIAIDLVTTLQVDRAPGMAWRRAPIFAWAAAVGSWLMLFIGPVLLAAFTMLMIDRNYGGTFFVDGAGGAPLLWQHFTWIFYSGAYMLILIFAFAAVAEIFAVFSGNELFNRNAVMISIAAVAVIGTLAYMQNMYTAPIGIGWKYFGMLMSLALIVPVGLIFFNLISTLNGGALRMRTPVLFAIGALVMISLGLAAEMQQSLVGAAFYLKNTTDSTAATSFALIGGAVFGGFAALHYWFPKITGRSMGEALGRASFFTTAFGTLLAFVPMALAGWEEDQVVDVYKFFNHTGVNFYNLLSSIGVLILFVGVVLILVNAVASIKGGARAGHDPWGGDTLEWFTLSPPPVHNFDVQPDVRSARPLRDIRAAIAARADAAEERAAHESQPVA